MPTTSLDDLRSATRIGVRTPVVVYTGDANGQLVRCRAWTDDLSSTGAKITSEKALIGDEIYIRVMLPDLKDQVIACEIVREIRSSNNSISLFDIRRSFYGIRFIGLASDAVLEQVEMLDNAALNR